MPDGLNIARRDARYDSALYKVVYVNYLIDNVLFAQQHCQVILTPWFLYAIFSGGHLVDGDVPSTKHIDNFLWMLSDCPMGGKNVEVIILEH